MSEAFVQIFRTGWDVHPTLLVLVVLLILAYLLGVSLGVTRGGQRLPTGNLVAFALAIGMLLLILHSPLHHLADEYLFSAHMVQHLILTLAVAPLLLLGMPGWLVRPLVDRPWVRRAARTSLYPVVAFLAFNVPFAFIHFPALYDALFGSELSHRATHAALLALAMLTWLPLASPIPDVIPRLSAPGAMLYCFLQTIPGAMVGSLLSFVDWVIFRHYGAKPMLLGVSPMADQQLGGLLMWVVGGTYFLLILTVIFFRWADREERTAYAGGTSRGGASGERETGQLQEALPDRASGRP